MAAIQSNTNNTYYAILTVNETNYSVADNYSDVYYELNLYSGSKSFSGYTIGYRVSIDNYQVAYHDSTGNQTSINANSSKLVVSGTQRIYHNSDGTKRSMPISFEIWTNNLSYLPVSLSASGSMDLTDLPRNTNVYNSVRSKTLNSITIDWSTTEARDHTQYSIDGGDWQDPYVTVASDQKSGYYTIWNLTPNTTYIIKTRCKRTDSQTWSEAGNISVTTYDVAKITSAPDINLGDSARIVKTNPSSSRNVIRIETLNPVTTIATREQTTDDMIINFTDSELDTLYKKMGGSNSITIRYVVDTHGDTVYCHYVDRTCTLTGNQKTGHVNVSGQWKRTKRFVNVNGQWKRSVRWVNVNGIWRRCI